MSPADLVESSMEKLAVPSAQGEAEEDHRSVLSRMVATVSQDHAQLRTLVYEFARRKLRRNLYPQFEEGDWQGIEERMRALEEAIDEIETGYADKVRPLMFNSDPPLTTQYIDQRINSGRPKTAKAVTLGGRSALASLFSSSPGDITQLSPLRPMSDGDVFFAFARFDKRTRANFWWKVQLSFAVLVGVVIYAASDGRSALSFLGWHGFDSPPTVTATSSGNANGTVLPDGKANAGAIRSGAPGIPIPSEYGAYALSKGQLTEIDVLPMRVPDPRVAISPVISTPSRVHLPAGKLEFVVFKRDLMNSAPDKVMVRVVAQVVRTLTFDGEGKAITTNLENTWVVRGNSYPMRVAPVADNPEMVVIRPDRSDLALPAGRYALVFKSVSYDFTVDGPANDAAHCLERTDALMSPVYTECRNL